MAYFRQRWESHNVSQEAAELLLSSWRQKSSKSYDSLFHKWSSWCDRRSSDPISGPISEVVNFLAHLFSKGYQYRSLNAYRSAISSVHEKVDGYEVGQHPLVSRLLKGAFNKRPPQPRYSSTWNVNQVLNYLEKLGDNESLSLQELTHKTTMLMALTRPSRSADLMQLNLHLRQFLPEGVIFKPAGLTKQARQNKPLADFFFPSFPHNKRLCPVEALKAYEERTKPIRNGREKLFLAIVKPHNPVSSPTIARWLRTVLGKAGIDTAIFKAHSVRSAAVTAAASASITTVDILNAADWSTELVFQRFYYKPSCNTAFGEAVLSTSKGKLQTTTS